MSAIIETVDPVTGERVLLSARRRNETFYLERLGPQTTSDRAQPRVLESRVEFSRVTSSVFGQKSKGLPIAAQTLHEQPYAGRLKVPRTPNGREGNQGRLRRLVSPELLKEVELLVAQHPGANLRVRSPPISKLSPDRFAIHESTSSRGLRRESTLPPWPLAQSKELPPWPPQQRQEGPRASPKGRKGLPR
jgi:hypothetical protein